VEYKVTKNGLLLEKGFNIMETSGKFVNFCFAFILLEAFEVANK